MAHSTGTEVKEGKKVRKEDSGRRERRLLASIWTKVERPVVTPAECKTRAEEKNDELNVLTSLECRRWAKSSQRACICVCEVICIHRNTFNSVTNVCVPSLSPLIIDILHHSCTWAFTSYTISGM